MRQRAIRNQRIAVLKGIVAYSRGLEVDTKACRDMVSGMLSLGDGCQAMSTSSSSETLAASEAPEDRTTVFFV